MPSDDAAPPRPQIWLMGNREAWFTSWITAALSGSSVSSQSVASAISWGADARRRGGHALGSEVAAAGQQRGQHVAAFGPCCPPAPALHAEQVAHEVGFVVHVDQHVGEVGLRQAATDQLAARGFGGPGQQVLFLAGTPFDPGQLEPAPPRVDGESRVACEPGLDRGRHRLEFGVECGHELAGVGGQPKGSVVVQPLGFPHRLRDQVVVELGPAARPLDGHVAALDPLVEHGQQRHLVMRPRDRRLSAGLRGRLLDMAAPSRGQEADGGIVAKLAPPFPVDLAQMLDREAQLGAGREAQGRRLQQGRRMLARGGIPAVGEAEVRTRIALAQSPATLDQQADFLPGVACIDAGAQLGIGHARLVQHERAEVLQHRHGLGLGRSGGLQQVGPVLLGAVVDPGDKLVLHLDEGVRRLGNSRFQRADQNGVPLCGIEALQAPGVVGVPPAREQAAHGGMHDPQRRPLRKAEAAHVVEPCHEGDQGCSRDARHRELEPVQPRPRRGGRAIGRDGQRQELVELFACLRRQVGRERLERRGERLLAGAGQEVADRARAWANHALLQQPSAGERIERRRPRHGSRRGRHVVKQALTFDGAAAAEAEMAAQALVVVEPGVLAGGVSLQRCHERQREKADLFGQSLDGCGRHASHVAQEVAAPAQGAKLDGEAQRVRSAPAPPDLLAVRRVQREVAAQRHRVDRGRKAVGVGGVHPRVRLWLLRHGRGGRQGYWQPHSGMPIPARRDEAPGSSKALPAVRAGQGCRGAATNAAAKRPIVVPNRSRPLAAWTPRP